MITLLLLVRATYMIRVVLHTHPVRGESHNQRNTTAEVATTSLLFTTNRTDRTFNFVAIGNPERHVREASHRGSKQE